MPSIVSTLNGTKVKCVIDTNGRLFAVIDDVETYQQHFDNNGWASWQDAINAGYPLWFEPTPNKNLVSPNLLVATYTETFDFGIIFTNFTINLDFNKVALNGNVLVRFAISVSDDNVTFGPAVTGQSASFSHGRYVKVIATFTPDNKFSSCNFNNYSCNMLLN